MKKKIVIDVNLPKREQPDMKPNKQQLCLICDQEAKYRYSPDIDINGIGACTEHKEIVSFAYVMLLQGSREMFDKYVKRERNKWKKQI